MRDSSRALIRPNYSNAFSNALHLLHPRCWCTSKVSNRLKHALCITDVWRKISPFSYYLQAIAFANVSFFNIKEKKRNDNARHKINLRDCKNQILNTNFTYNNSIYFLKNAYLKTSNIMQNKNKKYIFPFKFSKYSSYCTISKPLHCEFTSMPFSNYFILFQ